MIEWPIIIRQSFEQGRVYFTRHSKREMEFEEYGPISIPEVIEASRNIEVLADYPKDQPYPSALLLGFTAAGRPLHIVSAYDINELKTIIVTIYQPDPERWVNYRRRA